MANRDWDVPKRDLLDIERTAQANAVEAADHLADVVEACGVAAMQHRGNLSDQDVRLLRQALTAYRIARGQDTGPQAEPLCELCGIPPVGGRCPECEVSEFADGAQVEPQPWTPQEIIDHAG